MNRWRWLGMVLATLFLACACTTTPPQEPAAVVPAARPIVMDYLKTGELDKADAEMRGWLSVNGNDDEVRFGLGIVQVLQGVEHVMQSFYRYGLTGDGFASFLPVFRLPVPPNPNPEAIAYEDLNRIFQTWSNDLQRATNTLTAIKDDQVKVPIAIGLARLDFDGDGQKNETESLWQIFSRITNTRLQPDDAAAFEIALDRGDAYWLEGYTHVLAAFSEFLLAYDRRDIFDAVGHLLFAKVKTPFASAVAVNLQNNQRFLDAIASLHLLRFPVAEGKRLETMHGHLTAMLSLSRRSWQSIMAETDDDREWIPNPRQKGVIPNVPISGEMVSSWLSFIDEAEALFAGKKLIPFWRSSIQSSNQGINLRRFFFEPRTFDLILWVQGSAAIPYLESGTLTDEGVWDRLLLTFGNNAIGFAIWFN